MRRRTASPLAVAAAVLLVGGCASSGVMASANLTNVDLREGNYRVVATDVGGEAEAHYLIGVSVPHWFQIGTLALVHVGGSEFLYRAAIADLWDNFRSEHGAVEGRSLALVNVRYDFDALNLIVYTRPTVSVRADVVEFGQ